MSFAFAFGLLAILSVLAVGFILLVHHVRNAPMGHEDDRGFHIDTEDYKVSRADFHLVDADDRAA